MPKNIENMEFEFAEKIPMFVIKLNGEEMGFLLDSGSPYMVLNSRYDESNNNIFSSVAESTNNFNAGAKHISSFTWGDLRLTNQIAMVADISHLEVRLGSKIHGLIGCAQFMGYDLLLDYSGQYVSLIDSLGETPGCMANAKSIPFIMSNHIPVITMQAAGKTFSMGLDTGAAQNALGKKHKSFLEKSDILTDITNDDVVRFNAEDTECGAYSCIIQNVCIGDSLEIDGMRFYLHDIGIPDVKIDGLLGYELFTKKRALIRYAKRELLLQDY